jgi:tetratricopeptide (TPR) repeat protein
MNFRNLCGLVLLSAAALLTGCPKGSQDNNAGTKAEALKDYDTALDYYNKALQTSPNSAGPF